VPRRNPTSIFIILAASVGIGVAGQSRNTPTATEVSNNANQLQARQNQIAAFINVNVVPMDSERVLTGQTVIVRNGLIAVVGPAEKVNVPAEALRIDGRGKYLMPGLADMHVHFEVFNEQVNSAMLRLFVANGVTTVLNLFGTPGHLELRERVKRGETLGPTIYTSGPFISNAPAPPPSPEEVERAVIAQKRAGYDVIKIHGDFSREAYHKVIEVAHRENMRVIGHLPRNLGIEAAFEEKQDAIAHAEEYLYAYFFFKPPTLPADPTPEARLRWIADQAIRIPSVAEATARAGIWVSPTLAVYHGIGLQVSDIDSMLKRPEMKYLPPVLASRFAPPNNTYIQRFKKASAPVFLAQADMLSRLVKGLRGAGVKMLAGTDTPVPSVVPGFSLHDELRELVAAGLTPYESLRTATANAAEFLRTDKFGTVSEGNTADLILVDANPLKDISNASLRTGVMVRGRWFLEEELEALIH
jgi:imidazolonepropionase-like amidohydrolase